MRKAPPLPFSLATETDPFKPHSFFLSLASVANGIVAADVNGDGKLDLVFGGLDGTPSVALGNGDGTFQNPVETGFPVATYAFALGDFTANGKR